MVGYKLLVFDWDGTLMDSEAHIVQCLRLAIRDAGLPAVEDAAIRNIIGLGLGEALKNLLPGVGDDLQGALVGHYRRHFLAGEHTPSELFPGASETLTRLAEEGYLLAVATGKGRQGLNHVLERTGLKHVFHGTRCVDEAPSKPHPQMLRDIMAVLDVAPGNTLVIGDTEYDVNMARNAGSAAVGVSYGVHGRARLLQCGALACLDSLHELPGWLATSAPISVPNT
ncbi:MAG: HAD-IA family hydrolase [Gammaproteobacteria bacterium]|nr:HAD-IA family hydrolase [Gammaproteobacteria bacterium]